MSESNYIQISEADRTKAKGFFDKAASVSGAGQYDFGIEMYLNGLKLDPESVEAHQALRDVALRRKAGGGKAMGMFEKMKFTAKGKDDLTTMLNQERILALDPGDTSAMTSLLEAAYRAGCYDTVLWIAPILTRANSELSKPDFSKYEKVRDHYAKLHRWKEAVEVCTRMVQMKPDDMDLKNDLKNLSAEEAMNKGKYGGSFRESIRDAKKQQAYLEDERDVVGDDYLARVAKEAEADLAKTPNDPAKISKLVEALRKMNTPAAEEKAGTVLQTAFESTGAYRFRLQLIDMRLKQLVAEDRTRRADIAATTDAAEKQEKVDAYKEFTASRADEELALFEEVAEQYPTEPKYKYEVAKRLINLKRFTDAIPLLQQAVNDPKLRTVATLELGKTFLAADFPDEAVDTLKGLSESYPAMAAGDDTARQIMYWLGRSYETAGNTAEAIKAYSQLLKWDFNYLDTQVRMKRLRNPPPSA